MKIAELLNVIDKTELCIYRTDVNEDNILANLSVTGDLRNYHKECEKLRALEAADEYVVCKVVLVTPTDVERQKPFICVEVEKEGAEKDANS